MAHFSWEISVEFSTILRIVAATVISFAVGLWIGYAIGRPVEV